MTTNFARDHHHLDRFNIDLNGAVDAYVHTQRCEEGLVYHVVVRRVVYDHTEETRVLSFVNECAAQAVVDAITTIILMLGRFDEEFARTQEDPDQALREAVANTVHSPFADGYIPH